MGVTHALFSCNLLQVGRQAVDPAPLARFLSTVRSAEHPFVQCKPFVPHLLQQAESKGAISEVFSSFYCRSCAAGDLEGRGLWAARDRFGRSLGFTSRPC